MTTDKRKKPEADAGTPNEYADEVVDAVETYEVMGPHPVKEKEAGETVDLHSADPMTVRLLERGQIRLVESDDNTGSAEKE
jgi:hypothetical protein